MPPLHLVPATNLQYQAFIIITERQHCTYLRCASNIIASIALFPEVEERMSIVDFNLQVGTQKSPLAVHPQKAHKSSTSGNNHPTGESILPSPSKPMMHAVPLYRSLGQSFSVFPVFSTSSITTRHSRSLANGPGPLMVIGVYICHYNVNPTCEISTTLVESMLCSLSTIISSELAGLRSDTLPWDSQS
jgi:hypothetical protein